MQLAVWTYEGPPHVGAMRVATAMQGAHYVLHAPQGDTYADLLFTMIERRDHRPPVTYTTFQARDLGSDTAEIFKTACADAYERFRPEAMLVGASCTAELLQDDPAGLSRALDLPIPVAPLELPSYLRKENWGAAETFYRLVRLMADPGAAPDPQRDRPARCAILGPTALGFRHRDDVDEIAALLKAMGVEVALVAPLDARPSDLIAIGAVDFAVVLYPETADTAARWLARQFKTPLVTTVPIGTAATGRFVDDVAGVVSELGLTAVDRAGVEAMAARAARAPWWSRSIDSTYLTGKRVFVFGDATHAAAVARVCRDEIGFDVVGLGCYNREFARDIRAVAADFGLEALITDDYLAVEEAIAAAEPELVLGTQMERHIAKRQGRACAVISAPVHVQDFPARRSPLMGFEGANVLFDTLIHPLVMGLEEHLLTMFRDDFEFADAAGPSHLGGHAAASPPAAETEAAQSEAAQTEADAPPDAPAASEDAALWSQDAERELKKIPFFVRGKARRNTERYAAERGVAMITVETLYEAKSHFSR